VKLSGHHIEVQLPEGYRVEQKIGQGGMAEVWQGRDLTLACDVAIKVVDDALRHDVAFVDRFQRELRILARLRHRRIVHVMTGGMLTEDRRLFMVMELLRGKTLRTLMLEYARAREVFDHEVAAYAAYQMLDALEAAHQAGIVHRDVKPDNVMVDADGELKLLDFGVAKAVDVSGPLDVSGARRRISTSTSTVLGTALYVAPERVAGLCDDHRQDLYPVGVILLWMLTGEYPYAVDMQNEAAVLRAHLEATPCVRREKNPRCTPELWEVGLRLMEKDPAARFESVAEAKAVLSALLRGSMLPGALRHPVVQKVVEEHKDGVVRAVVEQAAARDKAERAKRQKARAAKAGAAAQAPVAQAPEAEAPRPTLLPEPGARMTAVVPLALPATGIRSGWRSPGVPRRAWSDRRRRRHECGLRCAPGRCC
jgi:serine/threonine protein kinase